ncbi:hypothetical protein BCR39DRAFT_511337 [Naematelia encephala]|uniref:BZIP domain-containing protein n=1 Tax=Naematelia encephala TaxID=71784 RepID=A0A1Y2BLL1_9TREE|nr:hypothetical protein BCR39DRAFT_511337 [Naematelia encephala]
MSDSGAASVPLSKDRPEPRGRKPNDHLPPSRAREVQRAFRLRRAEHLAALEERIALLESENGQLRALLALPEADRPKIGSGPTGRGKSLREGGVPMSERVRARKEARARDRLARGLPEKVDDSDTDSMRDSESPGRSINDHSHSHSHSHPSTNTSNNQMNHQQQQQQQGLPLFSQPSRDAPPAFNYSLPMQFNLPVSPPDHSFGDFGGHLDSSSIFKSPPPPPIQTAPTPGFSGMFSNLFDEPSSSSSTTAPPTRSPPPPAQQQQQQQTTPNQPELLTRLKACCHLSDSHVVNDPGLLIFATRLCQSFPCQFAGVHPDTVGASDSDHFALEESWRALKAQLDPGGDADGENRINTGRMAAELVIRAAHSRGQSGWIICRYREGMSIKRALIVGLVNGLGGKMD